MSKPVVDNGKPIDWGKTSDDYARFRDIYPEAFYEKLRYFGIGLEGQTLLDLGTGAGVIARTLAGFGVKCVGTDISEGQIEAAKALSDQMSLDVTWKVCPAESTGMPDNSFDAVTACQCFWYFDKTVAMDEIRRVLKPDGRLAVMYMSWLPEENSIAAQTEELVLKHNPDWKGYGFKGCVARIPDWLDKGFEVETFHRFRVMVPFTRESWRGRIRACRGVGAAMHPREVESFDREHGLLLERIAPESFSLVHEVWFEIYRVLK